ncbi:MAG: hypothetical protein J6W19_10860 [Prevotella sp.]|nr:hypothetical protein [Prevotella sp.]
MEALERGLTGLTIIKNFQIIAFFEKIFEKYFDSLEKSSTFAPAKRETTSGTPRKALRKEFFETLT